MYSLLDILHIHFVFDIQCSCSTEICQVKSSIFVCTVEIRQASHVRLLVQRHSWNLIVRFCSFFGFWPEQEKNRNSWEPFTVSMFRLGAKKKIIQTPKRISFDCIHSTLHITPHKPNGTFWIFSKSVNNLECLFFSAHRSSSHSPVHNI